MLKRLVYQLITLLLVSSLSGAFFISIGSNFIIGFFAGTVLQFGLYFGFTTVVDIYATLQNKKLENERIREFSFQSLEVTCPCFKQIKQIIPIRLNTDLKYKCIDCNKTVSVLITPETAIATEPILNTEISLNNKEIMNKLSNATNT